MVKTPPFHGGNTGSNPVRVIIKVRDDIIIVSGFFYYLGSLIASSCANHLSEPFLMLAYEELQLVPSDTRLFPFVYLMKYFGATKYSFLARTDFGVESTI